MGALTRPVGYFPVWDDTGSGAKQDGSVWRPACPGSYRAMGDVTSSSHTVPALDEVVCVHETALSAANPGNEIWNDTGSGARRNFAAWDIVSLGPDANFSYATRGLFFADASHNRPVPASIGGLWAIKLPRSSGVAATPITAPPPPAQTQGMSRQALEDEFRSCSEARQFGAPTDMSFTASLYWRYLGHGPDGNFQIHSARISHGQVNYAQLEDEFRTCPEAQQHGPSTNLDFVTSLYWRYLGHGPDGNLQMHTNRLVK
jgi:hypothetical protein